MLRNARDCILSGDWIRETGGGVWNTWNRLNIRQIADWLQLRKLWFGKHIFLFLIFCYCSWFSGWLWQNIRAHPVLFFTHFTISQNGLDVLMPTDLHYVCWSNIWISKLLDQMLPRRMICKSFRRIQFSSNLHLFHHFAQLLSTNTLINKPFVIFRITKWHCPGCHIEWGVWISHAFRTLWGVKFVRLYRTARVARGKHLGRDFPHISQIITYKRQEFFFLCRITMQQETLASRAISGQMCKRIAQYVKQLLKRGYHKIHQWQKKTGRHNVRNTCAGLSLALVQLQILNTIRGLMQLHIAPPE